MNTRLRAGALVLGSGVGAYLIGRSLLDDEESEEPEPQLPGRTWEDCDITRAGFSAEVALRFQTYGPMAESTARRFGVPPDLVLGTIFVESRFNPRAVSSVGATGLMQLMPATGAAMAGELGIPNEPFDPAINIQMGTHYLRKLLNRWNDVIELAVASYFAGPGGVKKRLDRDGELPPSWQSYVSAVLRASRKFGEARRLCAAIQ